MELSDNPNDDVVLRYGEDWIERYYLVKLNISRLFHLYPDYKAKYRELEPHTCYIMEELKTIHDIVVFFSEFQFQPVITLEEKERLEEDGWKLIPSIAYDAVNHRISLHHLVELAVIYEIDEHMEDYVNIHNRICRFNEKEKLFFVLRRIGIDKLVKIYGKDTVIGYIRRFPPVIDVIKHIIDVGKLNYNSFEIIDAFADHIIDQPYVSVIAMATSKPELFVNKINIHYTNYDKDLNDRIWHNLQLYTIANPEIALNIIEKNRSSTNLMYSYALQALWLVGIELDDSSIDKDYLDLEYIRINDEKVIDMFIRGKHIKVIAKELYYAWDVINPYVIEYIMKKTGLTRSSVLNFRYIYQ
jgi:hypothetical protein